MSDRVSLVFLPDEESDRFPAGEVEIIHEVKGTWDSFGPSTRRFVVRYLDTGTSVFAFWWELEVRPPRLSPKRKP